jgi:hypothetical protein
VLHSIRQHCTAVWSTCRCRHHDGHRLELLKLARSPKLEDVWPRRVARAETSGYAAENIAAPPASNKTTIIIKTGAIAIDPLPSTILPLLAEQAAIPGDLSGPAT